MGLDAGIMVRGRKAGPEPLAGCNRNGIAGRRLWPGTVNKELRIQIQAAR